MPSQAQAVPNEDEFSFSAFANQPFYRDVNSRLLGIAQVENRATIIDLGCGTGGVTELMLDRLKTAREGLNERVQAAKADLGGRVTAAREGLQDRVEAAKGELQGRAQAARETVIYAIDHSAVALRAAVAGLGQRKEAAVRFVQAEVQQLSTAVREQADAIVYCNSIHYVPDKASLLAQLRQKLRPGGVLAINTSFFEGSHPQQTGEFYRRWMLRSFRILKREYDMMPDRAQKVEARRHLTADEYVALLDKSGFKVTQKDLMDFEVPIEGWLTISAFSDWIQGIMPGVPLDKGRAALQKGLREVFAEMQLKTVPRTWLSLSAVRA